MKRELSCSFQWEINNIFLVLAAILFHFVSFLILVHFPVVFPSLFCSVLFYSNLFYFISFSVYFLFFMNKQPPRFLRDFHQTLWLPLHWGGQELLQVKLAVADQQFTIHQVAASPPACLRTDDWLKRFCCIFLCLYAFLLSGSFPPAHGVLLISTIQVLFTVARRRIVENLFRILPVPRTTSARADVQRPTPPHVKHHHTHCPDVRPSCQCCLVRLCSFTSHQSSRTELNSLTVVRCVRTCSRYHTRNAVELSK